MDEMIGGARVKIRSIYLGVYFISILLMACGNESGGGNDRVIEKSNVKGEKDNVAIKYDMTEEQEALLCKISIDEEEVKAGKLSKWQKEVLNQYDYAMAYLKDKYPSYTFHIVDCQPKNKLNEAYSLFNFEEASDTEGYYSLYLYVEEDKYSAEDNFYGYVIGTAYENKLKALLTNENIPCEKVEARLDTVQGEQFHENMNIDEIIDGKISMQQITDIYINGNSLKEESYEEINDKIQKIIEGKKIYGSYCIKILDYVNGGNEINSKDFNVFY